MRILSSLQSDIGAPLGVSGCGRAGGLAVGLGRLGRGRRRLGGGWDGFAMEVAVDEPPAVPVAIRTLPAGRASASTSTAV